MKAKAKAKVKRYEAGGYVKPTPEQVAKMRAEDDKLELQLKVPGSDGMDRIRGQEQLRKIGRSMDTLGPYNVIDQKAKGGKVTKVAPKTRKPLPDVTPKNEAFDRNFTKDGKPRLFATSGGKGEGAMGQRR